MATRGARGLSLKVHDTYFFFFFFFCRPYFCLQKKKNPRASWCPSRGHKSPARDRMTCNFQNIFIRASEFAFAHMHLVVNGFSTGYYILCKTMNRLSSQQCLAKAQLNLKKIDQNNRHRRRPWTGNSN